VAFHVTKADGYRAGLAWVELSTGECVAASGTEGQVLDELARLRPAEILVPELPSGATHEIGARIEALGIKAITARPGWQFTLHHAREQIHRQWQVKTVGGFGFADDDPAVFAAAALLTYLEETQKTGLSHIRPLRRHVVENHLSIDPKQLAEHGDRPHRPRGHNRRLSTQCHRSHRRQYGREATSAMAAISTVRA